MDSSQAASDVAASPAPGQSRLAADRFLPVPLRALYDCVAWTSVDHLDQGRLNVWGNSLPASPLTGTGPVPFSLASGDGSAEDHVRCAGQFIALPRIEADWIHVVATAERRCEDTVCLHYADGSADREWIRVSDFWESRPHFGNQLVLRSGRMHYPKHVQENVHGYVWSTRVPVIRQVPLSGIRLPDNIALHVFAMTLELRP